MASNSLDAGFAPSSPRARNENATTPEDTPSPPTPTSARLSGLRNPQIAAHDRYSVTSAQLAWDLLHRVVFAPWIGFDELVTSSKNKVEEVLCGEKHNGCRVLDELCPGKWCSEIATNKRRLLSAQIESEADLCVLLHPLLLGLTDYLAEQGMWDGYIFTERRLNTGRNADSEPLSDSQVEVVEQRYYGLQGAVVESLNNPVPGSATGDAAVNIRPDFAVRRAGDSAPNCTIEVKTPNHFFRDQMRRNECSETEMSTFLTEYFDDIRRNLQVSGEDTHSGWLYNAVCQTILQAMHTTSGRSSLTTYNHTLYLQVLPFLSYGSKMLVLVSGLYPSNSPDNSMYHSMIAFLKDAHANSRQGIYNSLAEMVKVVKVPKHASLGLGNDQNSVIVNRNSNDDDDKKDSNSERDSGKQAKSTPIGARFSEEARGDHVVSVTGQDKNRAAEGLGYTVGSNEIVHSVTEAYFAMENGELLVLSQEGLTTIFTVAKSKKGRELGATGVVYRGSCGSLNVAVKKWNEREEHGLTLLQREIAVYLWIWRERKDLLGDVVPKVFAIANVGKKNVTLVTEFVGWPLEYETECVGNYDKTVWVVNGKRLNDRDVREICSAATEGLRKLVNNNIWHGDAAPRNLRVVWCEETRRWRVWWIDLGNSRVRMDRSEEENKVLSSRIAWRIDDEVTYG